MVKVAVFVVRHRWPPWVEDELASDMRLVRRHLSLRYGHAGVCVAAAGASARGRVADGERPHDHTVAPYAAMRRFGSGIDPSTTSQISQIRSDQIQIHIQIRSA